MIETIVAAAILMGLGNFYLIHVIGSKAIRHEKVIEKIATQNKKIATKLSELIIDFDEVRAIQKQDQRDYNGHFAKIAERLKEIENKLKLSFLKK